MAGAGTTALDLYEGWEAYQDLLITAVEPLSPDQLRLRTTDRLRSVGETCRHIIGARARWAHYVLGLDGQETEAFGRWDRNDMPERSAEEIVTALRSTWGTLRTALGSWSVDDLAVTVPNTDPEPGEPAEYTRRWIIWHLVEHDIHHGGEITEILGAHGLQGLDL